MSTLVTYTTHINNAQKAYTDNQSPLQNLADTSFKTAALEIDAKATEFQVLTPLSSDYAALKTAFVQFTAHSITNYNTMLDTHKLGTEAIATLNAAIAFCTKFKPTQQEALAIKNHMLELGYAEQTYNEREEALLAGVTKMPTDLAELQALSDKITAQLPVLQKSLDTACFLVKKAEGKTTYADEYLPSIFLTFLSTASENMRKKTLPLEQKAV